MNKFKLALKKELFVYLGIFFMLSLIMHSDLLSNPSSRFDMIQEKGNYSHPFVYTFVIYSIVFIIKKFLDFIISLFENK